MKNIIFSMRTLHDSTLKQIILNSIYDIMKYSHKKLTHLNHMLMNNFGPSLFHGREEKNGDEAEDGNGVNGVEGKRKFWLYSGGS
jgi:hypothetical protein